MTNPEAFLRRSPLAPAVTKAGLGWRALSDAAIATGAGGLGAPDPIAIADLSPLPRLGFKGRETIAAMQRRGVVVEAEPNRAFRQPDGGLCLVLAASEVVLLSGADGDGRAIDALHAGWSIDLSERTYPVLRRDSHAWFRISGDKCSAMLAKICGVDMRRNKFPNLAIAQTSVAKLSAIVVRDDIGPTLAFHVLADTAASLYFCDCLLDAAQEFGGRLVGSD